MTGEVPSGASDTPPPVHADRGIGRLASRFGSWMQQRKEYLQRIYRCTRGYFADIWERVANRGLKYWVRLLLFLIAGGILSFWADRSSVWLEFRYRVYQHFQHILPRQPPHRETAVLLIGDDEYWKGGLRRVPFRRDYLAKLLRELDSAGAAVVILDVELRAPMPDSSPGLPLEAPEYQHETVELVETINAMSNVAHVVVPKTANKRNGRWFHEPDVVDNLEFTSSRVLRGHVLLAQEKWHIPTSLTLPEGPLDSIALAAAKAKDPALNDFLGKFSEDQLPFGGYL